jgi:hypothetical protein
MPFASKRQQRAMFAGAIPGLDKNDAKEWAKDTDFKKLPDRAPAEKGKPTMRSKKAGSENDHRHNARAEQARLARSDASKWDPNGSFRTGMAGVIPLPGTGGVTAYFTGPEHNRGRRSLAAAAGGTAGAMLLGPLGKGIGAGLGNEIADRMTRHEREPLKTANGDMLQHFLDHPKQAENYLDRKERERTHRGKTAAAIVSEVADFTPELEALLTDVFKGASLGTAVMNPKNVGKLRGMMTTNALKAPGYGPSAGVTNPRRNIISAMNAGKPK